MKKNVGNVCVTIALVFLALVIVFAYAGCVAGSAALLALSMLAGTGFVVAVNCLTGRSHDRTAWKPATAK